VALAAGIATLQNSNLCLMNADLPREFSIRGQTTQVAFTSEKSQA
jgi:hypothetical protein